jgi:hypothetical protein
MRSMADQHDTAPPTASMAASPAPGEATRVEATHAADGMVGPHGSMDDHGADHGHDDHAHAAEVAVEKIDLPAWGAGLLGVLLGIGVVISLLLASGGLH